MFVCRQVPPGYLLQGGLRRLEGDVEAGFGRGSAEMGVPTANLPPGPLEDTLQDLPIGVYFGCVAQCTLVLLSVSCLLGGDGYLHVRPAISRSGPEV